MLLVGGGGEGGFKRAPIRAEAADLSGWSRILGFIYLFLFVCIYFFVFIDVCARVRCSHPVPLKQQWGRREEEEEDIMEGMQAYGAGKAGGAFDPVTFLQQPQTILRIVSWVRAAQNRRTNQSTYVRLLLPIVNILEGPFFTSEGLKC